MTNDIATNQGLRQACSLSPTFFNIYIYIYIYIYRRASTRRETFGKPRNKDKPSNINKHFYLLMTRLLFKKQKTISKDLSINYTCCVRTINEHFYEEDEGDGFLRRLSREDKNYNP
jgi:hypothetical protein